MPGKFEIKTTRDYRCMFHLKAGNGEIILTSERFRSRAKLDAAIEAVRECGVVDEQFDRRSTNMGAPYFVLESGDGEILGWSEMYGSRSARDNGIASVRRNAPDARVVELAPDPEEDLTI